MNNEQDGLDGLRDLFRFTNATPSKGRRSRGARQWHWDYENQWSHYSSHWSKEEALENTPTASGCYYLVRGSHGSFVLEREIINEEE